MRHKWFTTFDGTIETPKVSNLGLGFKSLTQALVTMTLAVANTPNDCVWCLIVADEQKTLHYFWNDWALISQMASCSDGRDQRHSERLDARQSWKTVPNTTLLLSLTRRNVSRNPALAWVIETSGCGKNRRRVLILRHRIRQLFQEVRVTMATICASDRGEQAKPPIIHSCRRLTVAFPAMTSDRQAGDGVPGDPRGRGCDFHLDGPSSLFIGLQSSTVKRRFDGVSHLRKIKQDKALYIQPCRYIFCGLYPSHGPDGKLGA